MNCPECTKEIKEIDLLDIAKRHGYTAMYKCEKCEIIFSLNSTPRLIDTKMSQEDYLTDLNIDKLHRQSDKK